MKIFKKVLALALAALMLVGLVACNTGTTDPTDPSGTGPSNKGPMRTITVGVHWEWHYDSNDTSVYDDPAYGGDLNGQMRFDIVKQVEETYNCRIEFVDLTWDGVRESLNTSVLAGTPECDIYLVDLAAGVSAVMNGLAIDLKTVLPADSDLLGDQKIMSYMSLNGEASLMLPVKAENRVSATYPLAFNKQLLEQNNLEDPRELYKRGEWTWDKFVEYCRVLTKDNDGDGVMDQYGFNGFIEDYLAQLLMSNGTDIAATEQQHLDSPATIEVFDFISKLYNEYKVAAPSDPSNPDISWVDVGRYDYRNGNIGFWPSAAWLCGEDYDPSGSVGYTLDFDTVYVQWPVGPSGNQETNNHKVPSDTSYFIIPTGVEDPALVYQVFEAWNNWYMGDTTIRDDKEALSWWYVTTAKDPVLQEENFQVMFDMGGKEQFDLYKGLGIQVDWTGLLTGTMTASQFTETYKQQYQDALDNYFGS